MRRVGLILLCLGLLWAAASCGGKAPLPPPQPETHTVPDAPDTAEPEDAPASRKTALVVYFSRVGNTDFPEDVDVVSSATLNQLDGTLKGNAQLIAEWMADEAHGDLAEIQTEYGYPADYRDTTDVAKQEQVNRARPILKGPLVSLDSYETVYLVFPIWWSDMPMAVYSFFDAYDFAGKTLVVSVTHEGSGFSRAVETVRSLEPEAEVVEGLALQGSMVVGAEGIVRQFIQDIR